MLSRLGIFLLLVGPATVAAFSTSGKKSAARVFVGTPPKPKDRLVEDFMTTKLHTLYEHQSVDEAISLLLKTGLSGAPVLDARGEYLVGALSSFDVLQKEAGGAVLAMEGSTKNIQDMMAQGQKIIGNLVSDLMTPHDALITVTPKDSMRRAASLMTQYRLHRLTVVDPNDPYRLVGVLSSTDVMRDVWNKVQLLSQAKEDEQTDFVSGAGTLEP